MNILFIADIMGKPGRNVLSNEISSFVQKYQPDIVIANGENSAGGFGITPSVAEELFVCGIDIITMGNHVWDKKEGRPVIADNRVLRPANYPEGVEGQGFCVAKTKKGYEVGIINLMGRVFMTAIECPFRKADAVIEEVRKRTNIIIVDMHAEATSEKVALGWYLDGKVSAVIGTHTHVQTADEKILPKGTAYITDAGVTGPQDSVIGVKKEIIIKRFLTQVPTRYEVSNQKLAVEGVIIHVDDKTGLSTGIHRIRQGDFYANER